MQSRFFQRYVWLVSTISGAGHITKEEIDRRWARSSVNESHETTYPSRTFLRHKEDIAEIFGIEIEYSRATNTYHLSHTEDMHTGELRQWLMNTFVVNNALTESQSLHKRILAEQIPAGHHYLPIIIAAMRDNHVLQITHNRFGHEPQCLMLEPYCLKVFKQRWYVYGRPSNHPGEKRIYALDRISSLQETEATFRLPADFDAEQEFADYYGVFTNRPVECVRIRVINEGVPFLRTLPLHHSQREVLSQSEYTEFEYRIAPTFDFIQQLRTYGSQLIVLSPEWLRNEMRAEAQRVAEQYTTTD